MAHVLCVASVFQFGTAVPQKCDAFSRLFQCPVVCGSWLVVVVVVAVCVFFVRGVAVVL